MLSDSIPKPVAVTVFPLAGDRPVLVVVGLRGLVGLEATGPIPSATYKATIRTIDLCKGKDGYVLTWGLVMAGGDLDGRYFEVVRGPFEEGERYEDVRLDLSLVGLGGVELQQLPCVLGVALGYTLDILVSGANNIKFLCSLNQMQVD